ncbi:hypothetical protein EHW66_08965 [Erwinia psidii]|uniref:AMP-binding protein n=1 Tax=Erwinia psidii TaxID=69224 RepID=UPI00226B37B6|nr:AMP-binding protein [Erwinia psidii]MCX8965137.1 hypothetical protein [Erwinia psidii]
MNLPDYLLMNIYRHRDSTFLIENDRVITYQQLLESVLIYAKTIRDNTSTEKKVLLRESSAFSTLVRLLALLNNNISVALVHRGWQGTTVDENYWQSIENYKHQASSLELQKMLTEEIMNRKECSSTLSFHSSGTTSDNPTEMTVSQDNIFFSLTSISATLKYNNESRIGVTTPLSFDYSLYQFLMAIASGSSVVYSDFRLKAHRSFDIFARYSCNYLALIPGLLKQYLTLHKLKALGQPPCYITLTGEFFEQQTLQQCHQLLPETHIITMYGITECKRVSITPPEICVIESNCVGLAIPGTSVLIKDKDERILRSGTGECIARGAHVINGYASEGPCQFTQHEGQRQLNTSDIIHVDHDGFISFLRRSNEIIKINGKRIDSTTVKRFIQQIYPDINDISCRENKIIITSRNDLPEKSIKETVKHYFYEHHAIVLRDIVLRKKENINLKGM